MREQQKQQYARSEQLSEQMRQSDIRTEQLQVQLAREEEQAGELSRQMAVLAESRRNAAENIGLQRDSWKHSRSRAVRCLCSCRRVNRD